MYVLAIHTITDITAKVPFAMMVLQDAIKTKAIPSQLKVTQVLPTSGPRSMSMWEASSVEEVETYTNQLLSDWCINECFTVVEDQAYGLNLQKAVSTTQQNAELVLNQTANTTKAVVSAVSTSLTQMDAKFHLNEKAKMLGTRVAELTVKAKESAEVAGAKALENPTVASSVGSLQSAFGFIGKKAYEAGTAVRQKAHEVNTVVVARVQQINQSGVTGGVATDGDVEGDSSPSALDTAASDPADDNPQTPAPEPEPEPAPAPETQDPNPA
uniref:Senescence domain-containing protein n=1 Tax=Pyramimonas obovata TaxID=1411642 RepID=A0A7S0QY23_9CHLO|mmetsp:Transcript_17455/g.38002  ORF Transcript_17455/g.38002 Transcript_17455/m.38002 type:complete len:270 (+) Transcript_17455:147-956(+)